MNLSAALGPLKEASAAIEDLGRRLSPLVASTQADAHRMAHRNDHDHREDCEICAPPSPLG
ncbi:hypothetical protein ACQEVF_25265 [Nonomuraea polychroma]|uniref:hypothetical protein n=1 Tax=Nonomuraea polychroma TaxID=46176 RepID=UPI003D8B0323